MAEVKASAERRDKREKKKLREAKRKARLRCVGERACEVDSVIKA